MSSKKWRVRTNEKVLGHYSGKSELEAILHAIASMHEIASLDGYEIFYIKHAGSSESEKEWPFIQVYASTIIKAINNISYTMENCTSFLLDLNKMLKNVVG